MGDTRAGPAVWNRGRPPRGMYRAAEILASQEPRDDDTYDEARVAHGPSLPFLVILLGPGSATKPKSGLLVPLIIINQSGLSVSSLF